MITKRFKHWEFRSRTGIGYQPLYLLPTVVVMWFSPRKWHFYHLSIRWLRKELEFWWMRRA